jgi:hypothetical protein
VKAVKVSAGLVSTSVLAITDGRVRTLEAAAPAR